MTSSSPRRHAPAGSSEILASRGIGWLAIARSANRSRSGAASMNRCAALARRTKRSRSTNQVAPTMRIGTSAVVTRQQQRDPLDGA